VCAAGDGSRAVSASAERLAGAGPAQGLATPVSWPAPG